MVKSAALQLAGSRWHFAKGETIPGSRLADASRANLMSAEDTCAREAAARAAAGAESDLPWFRKEASK